MKTVVLEFESPRTASAALADFMRSISVNNYDKRIWAGDVLESWGDDPKKVGRKALIQVPVELAKSFMLYLKSVGIKVIKRKKGEK